ncbi:MAG: hypothetical protein ACM32E_14135 [Gemmatimonadota bacterium]
MAEPPDPASGPADPERGRELRPAGPGAEPETRPAGPGAEPEPASGAGPEPGLAGAGPQPGGYPDRDRLARALRTAQRDLVNAHAELARLENSVTVAAGRAVVALARSPLRGGVRLPREAYRLWRTRRAGGARPGSARPGSAAPAAAGAAASAPGGGPAPLLLAQDRGGAGIGDRWLAAFTAPGYPGPADPAERGLVVTGVLTAAGCATLEPDAVAHPLLPHNADFVLEATGADLVLIQASALQPGSAWAYAADPAAADRGRRLDALISLARSVGKPVILLRDAPWSPAGGLDWLAARCDAVLDSDLGVQLARFNPAGLDPARPCDPVYAGARDPREPPALRQALDGLAGAGRGLLTVTGYLPWHRLPGCYRGNGVFLAGTAGQAREQLAAGARVIGPPGADLAGTGLTGTGLAETGPAGTGLTETGPAGTGPAGTGPAGAGPAGTALAGGAGVPDPAGLAGALRAARDAGCPEPAELVPVLREIFTGHATPVRLAELARLAGLPASPLPGRQVAVLATLTDPGEAGRLAAVLAAQRLAPAEVVVALAAGAGGPGAETRDGRARAGRAVTAALRPVAATGAAITLTAGPGLGAAAAAARSPWAVPWPSGGGQPPDYLLDLVCARECARADAVGYGPGWYAFAPIREAALARRELLLPGAPPPAAWPARGLRTVSITPRESS